MSKKLRKAGVKVYQFINNERGNTNISNMLWIIAGVVLIILILGFAKGWLPELFNQLKEKVSTIW